jgi:hypothetical protein
VYEISSDSDQEVEGDEDNNTADNNENEGESNREGSEEEQEDAVDQEQVASSQHPRRSNKPAPDASARGKSKSKNKVAVVGGNKSGIKKERESVAEVGGGKKKKRNQVTKNPLGTGGWEEIEKPESLYVDAFTAATSNFKRVGEKYFCGSNGVLWCVGLDCLSKTDTYYLNLRFLTPNSATEPAKGYKFTKTGICIPLKLFGKPLLSAFQQHYGKLLSIKKKGEGFGGGSSVAVAQSGTRYQSEEGTFETSLLKPTFGNSLENYRIFLCHTKLPSNKVSFADFPVGILPQGIEYLKELLHEFP